MRIVKTLFYNLETSLLTTFLIFFSFGQLQRIQLNQQVAFYLTDLIIVVFLGVIFFKTKPRKTKKLVVVLKKLINNFFLELCWVAWLGLGLLIGWATGNLALLSVLYLLRLIVYTIFVISLPKIKSFAYPPRMGLALTALLMAVWGLVQYLLLPDVRFLTVFGWDNHYFRLIGTLFDPAFMGMLLILGFGWWQSAEVLPTLPQKWRWLVQLLFIITLAATFSRASFIALVVLLGGLLVSKQLDLKSFIFSVAVLLITLSILPKPGGEGVNLARTSTAQARGLNIQEGLKLQGGQWWWGKGLFNVDRQKKYETPDHAQIPDSLPVMVVNATGLVGLVLAGLVLHKWFWSWWLADPVWTSLLIAVLTHSLFNNTFLQPFIFLALWGSKSNTTSKSSKNENLFNI